jgi:hypothetical protein
VVWTHTIDIERRLCRRPGLVDSGSHIILAAQTSEGFSQHRPW